MRKNKAIELTELVDTKTMESIEYKSNKLGRLYNDLWGAANRKHPPASFNRITLTVLKLIILVWFCCHLVAESRAQTNDDQDMRKSSPAHSRLMDDISLVDSKMTRSIHRLTRSTMKSKVQHKLAEEAEGEESKGSDYTRGEPERQASSIPEVVRDNSLIPDDTRSSSNRSLSAFSTSLSSSNTNLASIQEASKHQNQTMAQFPADPHETSQLQEANGARRVETGEDQQSSVVPLAEPDQMEHESEGIEFDRREWMEEFYIYTPSADELAPPQPADGVSPPSPEVEVDSLRDYERSSSSLSDGMNMKTDNRLNNRAPIDGANRQVVIANATETLTAISNGSYQASINSNSSSNLSSTARSTLIETENGTKGTAYNATLPLEQDEGLMRRLAQSSSSSSSAPDELHKAIEPPTSSERQPNSPPITNSDGGSSNATSYPSARLPLASLDRTQTRHQQQQQAPQLHQSAKSKPPKPQQQQQQQQQNDFIPQNDYNPGMPHRPYCIGHRVAAFNWLCQGIALQKVPVDLEPTPVSFDLDNNNIETLGTRPINIQAEFLNLEFNRISSIEDFTFNGSEIGILSLNGNRQLSFIHENAFANLKNLVKLDLSSTSISQLPTVGLQQLTHLIVRDTFALKRIPSIYSFRALREAHLTYSYHCCSFRFPQTHDPTAHEQHLKLQEEINSWCARKQTLVSGQTSSPVGESLSAADLSPQANGHVEHRPTTHAQQTEGFDGIFSSNATRVIVPANSLSATSGQQSPDHSVFGADDATGSGSLHKPVELPGSTFIALDDDGTKLMATTTTNQNHNNDLDPSAYGSFPRTQFEQDIKPMFNFPFNIECGELVNQYAYLNITCTPEPDAFNPCEDIMGYSVLRFAVWLVVGASVFGNLSVIVVLMGVFRRMSVPKFLQLNLALGDLFMGVYLAMLALADLTTVGKYFNYAIDWQHGFGCKVAGAASLFASQLSIFTLSVITFERYYTITYSIDLNMRLQLGWASRIMLIGWVYAFASAMLPVFADVNSYSKTSICLPMRTTYLTDKIFIFVLLLIDSSAFIIIFACYLKMYLLILRQKTEATAKERTVAMRMALLVSTDFACWAPIIFFGTTALFGQPLISVTNSKILIVFFYPLNSMANPFLYVISTRQYRRDLNYLTNRWQMWRKNLFKRHNDSYYSNNAYGGINQHPGALNVHLGAVAAMTGVANHLHHYQLNSNDNESAINFANLAAGNGSAANGATPAALVFNTSDGVKLHEQRVIYTKGHKGHYIIRHQILTGKRAHHMTSGNTTNRLARKQKPSQLVLQSSRMEAKAEHGDKKQPDQSSPAMASNQNGSGSTLPANTETQQQSDAIDLIDQVSDQLDGSNNGTDQKPINGAKSKQPTEQCKSWHHLCTERISAKCCRCCPAHLCQSSQSKFHSTSGRQRVATTILNTATTGTTQVPSPSSSCAGIGDGDEPIGMELDMVKARNLCKLAARESAELKSIALVSPMPIMNSSPPVSSESQRGECDSIESRERYSSLVDDIFRDTLMTSSRRESQKRASIDILGNLSTNEPTSSTSGGMERVSCSDQNGTRHRHQFKSSHSQPQQQHHHHHNHHHHRHRHHHHKHRHVIKQHSEFDLEHNAQVLNEVKRCKIVIDRLNPTADNSKLNDSSGTESPRTHRHRSSHHHNHHSHHHHNHHHHHKRHHTKHISHYDDCCESPKNASMLNYKQSDLCEKDNNEIHQDESSPIEVVNVASNMIVVDESEDKQRNNVTINLKQPQKEIESILKVRSIDKHDSEQSASGIQRVGSRLLAWKRGTDKSDKQTRVSSSSFRSSNGKERSKKRVSIIDHHSG